MIYFLGTLLSSSNKGQNLCSLFVGNLSTEAEESHLLDLFAKFGPLDILIEQEMYVELCFSDLIFDNTSHLLIGLLQESLTDSLILISME